MKIHRKHVCRYLAQTISPQKRHKSHNNPHKPTSSSFSSPNLNDKSPPETLIAHLFSSDSQDSMLSCVAERVVTCTWVDLRPDSARPPVFQLLIHLTKDLRPKSCRQFRCFSLEVLPAKFHPIQAQAAVSRNPTRQAFKGFSAPVISCLKTSTMIADTSRDLQVSALRALT